MCIQLTLMALQHLCQINSLIIKVKQTFQLTIGNSYQHLNWLPPKFPSNVRCIVSHGVHPPTQCRVREHEHYSITMETLTEHDAALIVETFLRKFSKVSCWFFFVLLVFTGICLLIWTGISLYFYTVYVEMSSPSQFKIKLDIGQNLSFRRKLLC